MLHERLTNLFYSKLNFIRIWLVVPYDLMEDRSLDDITLKFIFPSHKISIFHFSALLINTLLVHRRRQNMVEYSDTLGCALFANFSSNHILSLSQLICSWTGAWEHGICLLCKFNCGINNKEMKNKTEKLSFYFVRKWKRLGQVIGNLRGFE